MRFAVESWAPEYGAPSDDAALADADLDVDPWAERPPGGWSPIDGAPGGLLGDAVFVDGVQRVEANVWVTDPDGGLHHGICASYGAGAVRCDGAATIVVAEVHRGAFTASVHATDIGTGVGTFHHQLAASGESGPLTARMRTSMARLEADVAAEVGRPGDLVVVDGPLRSGHDRAELLGFVKTHARAYGPDLVRSTVAELAVGQRTPLLLLQGGARPRWSWYQRLPVEVTHAWAGVVRLERFATGTVDEAVVLADRVAGGLGRFASVPQKDPRAPQNLYPIGALERELRRRLGDSALVARALATAAASGR